MRFLIALFVLLCSTTANAGTLMPISETEHGRLAIDLESVTIIDSNATVAGLIYYFEGGQRQQSLVVTELASCAAKFGELFVDYTGLKKDASDVKTYLWSAEGNKPYDRIAQILCLRASNLAKPKTTT